MLSPVWQGEIVASRAGVAHNHHRGRARGPALTGVGALRLLADRRKARLLDGAADHLEPPRPLWWWGRAFRRWQPRTQNPKGSPKPKTRA